MGMSVDTAIDKVVLFLVIVSVAPTALAAFFNVTTTTWDAATIGVWGVMSILFIVGLFYGLRAKGGR